MWFLAWFWGSPSSCLFVHLWKESIASDCQGFFLILFVSTRHIRRLPSTSSNSMTLCHLRKKGSVLLAHGKRPPMKTKYIDYYRKKVIKQNVFDKNGNASSHYWKKLLKNRNTTLESTDFLLWASNVRHL